MVALFIFTFMGFVEQAITTLRNNRSLRKTRNTIKSQLDRWRSAPSRNPPNQELKNLRKTELHKRAKGRLLVFVIFLILALLASLLLLTNR